MVYIEIFIGLALSVLIHELGHAFFQSNFGLPVKLIQWGFGPRIFKIKTFEVRLIPISGGIHPVGSELTSSRIKGVVISLGGIIAQWIVTYIIAVLGFNTIPWLRNITLTFVFCACLSLFNLIPFKGTDGYYMFRSIFKKGGQQ